MKLSRRFFESLQVHTGWRVPNIFLKKKLL